MTWDQWLAIAPFALGLLIKVGVDVQAYLIASKHTALANIVGMAERQAASAARVLAALPPNSDAQTVERSLIANATDSVLTEMKDSVAKVAGASPGSAQAKVAGIVQGELDKLIVAPAPVAIVPASPVLLGGAGPPVGGLGLPPLHGQAAAGQADPSLMNIPVSRR
jgi:hypothetical protein